MHSNHSENRRRYPRLPTGYEVQLQPIGASNSDMAPYSHYGISRDISAGGMRISSNRPYPVHAQLLLAFESDELGWSRVISRVGSVVWSTPLPTEDGCLLGIQFGDEEDPGHIRLH